MEEDTITLENLASLLKRLAILSGPHGKMSEWLDVQTRLQDELQRYGLVLDYDEEDERYGVYASVLEGEREG